MVGVNSVSKDVLDISVTSECNEWKLRVVSAAVRFTMLASVSKVCGGMSWKARQLHHPGHHNSRFPGVVLIVCMCVCVCVCMCVYVCA